MLPLTSDVFEMLGKTGTATEKRWNIGVENMDDKRHLTPDVRKIRNMEKVYELLSLRYPDPKLTATLQVEYPELQVLGSWKKLNVRKKGAMKPRLASASFIWNGLYFRRLFSFIFIDLIDSGKLYIGGGFGETTGHHYRDLCCLDLNRLDTWRALAPYLSARARQALGCAGTLLSMTTRPTFLPAKMFSITLTYAAKLGGRS